MSKRKPTRPDLAMTNVDVKAQAFRNTFSPVKRVVNKRRLQNNKRAANIAYLTAAKGEIDPWKRLELRKQHDPFYTPITSWKIGD